MEKRLVHYYKFNIADWNLGTAHLSLTEEAIYFRLVNFYYDSESPIPTETQSVFRRLRMASDSVIAQQILDEFFTKTDKGYIHTRCDEILKEYRKTAKNNRSNGAKGGRPKKDAASEETQTKPSGLFSVTKEEPTNNPNQEPLTINQEPETNKDITQGKPAKKTSAKPELDYSVWPEKPDQQILTDWLTHRKSKRAAVSQTVVNACGEEFRKAATFGYSVNDCLKSWLVGGWQGFKFEWMQNQLSRGNQNAGQPKTSLIDRFIQNNYSGSGFEDDNRPMGSDGGSIRGQVVEPVRGDAGRIGPMEADLIGDYTAADSGSTE